MTSKTRLLGDFLIEQKLISSEQLEDALELQQHDHKLLGQILTDLGYIKEEEILHSLSEQLNVEVVSLKEYQIPVPVLRLLPGRLVHKFQILPIFATANKITLAMSNPLDLEAIDTVSRETQRRVEPVLAKKVDLLEAIENAYSEFAPNETALKSETEPRSVISKIELAAQQQFLDLLRYVSENNHNYLSFEFSKKKVQLHLRSPFYSILHQFPVEISYDQISRFLKSRADFISDISNPDFTGHYILSGKKNQFTIFFSGFQSGESAFLNLKFFDNSLMKDLSDTGILELHKQSLLTWCKGMSGVFCIVAPKGNGKTLILNSLAHFYQTREFRVISVQDNIEIKNENIFQIQLNPNEEIKWSILKRRISDLNPDLILIDSDCSQLDLEHAVELAAEGFHVIKTVPAISLRVLYSALKRCVNPEIFANLQLGVLNTRLLPRLCEHCKTLFIPEPALIQKFGVSIMEHSKYFKRGGCQNCHQTGYRGLTAVNQLFWDTFDPATKKFVSQTTDANHNYLKFIQPGLEQLKMGEVAVEDINQLRC